METQRLSKDKLVSFSCHKGIPTVPVTVPLLWTSLPRDGAGVRASGYMGHGPREKRGLRQVRQRRKESHQGVRVALLLSPQWAARLTVQNAAEQGDIH